MTYSVELVGGASLLAKLTPATYEVALTNLFTDATLYAEKVARDGVNHDTSALARDIASEVRSLMGRVFTTLAYARPVEEGRAPGARMPPPGAIKGWLRRHGKSDKLAFVVARAISRRGIKGRFFMKKAAEALERKLPDLLRKAGEDILAVWNR